MIENYLPILIVFILVSGFVFVSLIVTHLVGPRIHNPIKMMPYESGVDQVGETRIRFSIRFFLIALLFIIFDIEIIFLYPFGNILSASSLDTDGLITTSSPCFQLAGVATLL